MAAGAQQPSIVPTELEQQIFGRLLDVVHHGGLGTQLRVAGGWVRDKLLGKNSTDIDIALDDLTGKEFCEKITDYYEKVISHELKTPCVIPCKPGQSKHLETAKIILSDISDITIDFVNLRSEKYAENSRIPTAEYGMPEEDAFRRDLTINSLFYNINTNLVEDLTRRGLEDLKKGLIVTPLPAKVTFLDDPLRVLRAIRFAARFSFTLAGNLKEAASDEKVKLNLRSKISRERIGQEVDHMMSGKYPVDAMCHIRDLGLFYIVFAFPEKTVPPVLDKHDWLCVSHIEAAWNLAQSIGCSVFRGGSGSMSQDEQRRLCMYSALFTPVRNMVYTKKKEVVRYIIGNSLKLNGSDAEARTRMTPSHSDALPPLRTAVEVSLVTIGDTPALGGGPGQEVLALSSPAVFGRGTRQEAPVPFSPGRGATAPTAERGQAALSSPSPRSPVPVPADPGAPLGDLAWPRVGGGVGGLVPHGATWEEVIAFGGIPDPVSEGRRMSSRLQDQQDVDDMQLRCAKRAAKLRDIEITTGYFLGHCVDPYVVPTHSDGGQGAFGYWIYPLRDEAEESPFFEKKNLEIPTDMVAL
ncbi:unnamed protein product [Triticum aestivum]|uniref:Poly A polymerase head domain-containing protein n=1 Tax=Triticum aestivum TaxID=4565 RepID=A0A7H4LEP6_WHEAT|nr:unnamed protein product [Triticum aestivum]